MRLAIRLSQETNVYIETLKELFGEQLDNEVFFTKSQVVERSYLETKNIVDWNIVQNTKVKTTKKDFSEKETVSTLNLSEDTIKGIEKYLEIFPEIFGAKWVTKSFVIKLITKANLMRYTNSD